MTREETVKLIHIIVASYPSFKPSQAELKDMVEAWAFMFDEYPYNVVSVALKAFITTDTSGFPPSVGQIISIMHKMVQEDEDNEAEAWQMVSRAVSNSLYNSEEEFAKLPPIVQKAVGGAHNLKEWAMQDVQTFSTVTASNFRRVYATEVKKQEEYNRLPEQAKHLIERIKHDRIAEISNKEAEGKKQGLLDG